MSYSEKEFKDSNVNYLNKDFTSLKSSLMEYAKTYFPNTYRDFNETSPGMMLLEMSAYVGDVLSFYIDNQYKEMLLSLAEERRNVVNIANMLGYKIKATVPSKTKIRTTITIDSDVSDINDPKPDYTQAFLVKKGMQLQSTSEPSIYFETLEDVDFSVSTSFDSPPTASSYDSSTGLVSKYKLTRHVDVVSGERKTYDFTLSSPEKFLELTLPEKNVVDIISVVDSNGNRWYEVEYLAQELVPNELHYTSDDNRTSAYFDIDDAQLFDVPIPYTLSYIKTTKKFIVEVDHESNTKLIFGNGLLRKGESNDFESEYHKLQGVGMVLPGSSTDIDGAISQTLGTVYSTLGETPGNTVLTVTYRVGGGIKSNVSNGDISTIISKTVVGTDNGTLSAINDIPARGGSSTETIEEIRKRSKAFFATQNRCVTKEDYQARVMNLPSRFGGIAKSYVKRAEVSTLFNALTGSADNDGDATVNITEFGALYDGSIPTIEIFSLSYDKNKYLVDTPTLIQDNLRTYLSNYRIISDTVNIKQGFIVNFGVFFDVVAHKFANKSEVKIKCIDKIKDYFNIDKMQFRQPIYVSQLEYELMGIDGVRAVNYVTLTQNLDYNNSNYPLFEGGPLYNRTLTPQGINESQGTAGYGFQFDFSAAKSGDGSIIMPSIDPAVFELKKPNENIKGVVR